MRSNALSVFLLLLLVFSTGCAHEQEISYAIPAQPELSTGYTEKPGWETSEFAVAAANPLATDAGYQIIKAGGSAIDAAIAVQMVLTLVEPQSSGIGGGAFLLMYDEGEKFAYNGRERAPAGADEEMFFGEDGELLSFGESVRSGKSVGVPGTIAMLEVAHANHGRLEWSDLFTPAITLAEEGFNISPRLHGLLEADESLRNDPIARDLYYDENGDALSVGTTLQNPALAEILRNVADRGSEGFYNEQVAGDIASRVQSHERPGSMTANDILQYPDRSFEVEMMCNDWKSYTICGMPPPSSGHIAVMQILGIIEQYEADHNFTAFRDSLPTADWLHTYFESSKLAFADRALYIGDPEFVDPPANDWQSLLETDYLAKRSELITEMSMGEATAGDPGNGTAFWGIHPEQPEKGTSHISIVDPFGQAVSMTTTIEQGFGSRIMSDGGTGLEGGFHLNNELTDFSREPTDDQGRLIANRVEPNKQPRSSMSPSLIFDAETGEFVASVGSPGGAAIIHYTAKAIVGMLDWDLNAQQAINLPNFAAYNNPAAVVEQDRFSQELIDALEAMGHEITARELTSGLQAIQRTENGYFGGADPRREGVVMGD